MLSALVVATTLWLESSFAANLRIKFLDPNGKALEKVETRLTHLVTKRFEQETSNSQGQIEITGMTDGRYEFIAQLRNFFPIKEEIELTGNIVLQKVMFNQKFVDKVNKEVSQAVEKEEYATATEKLQQLITLFPENPVLHYNMAVAQAGLKDYEKSMAEIDTAIRFDASHKYEEKKKSMQRDLLLELGQKALNDRDFPQSRLTLSRTDCS